MKKSDLKTGMKVVLDDGTEYIVLLDVLHGFVAGYGHDAKDILVNPKKIFMNGI